MRFSCRRCERRTVIGMVFILCLTLCLSYGEAVSREEIQDDLFDVTFPTASDGWACGRWGAVFHTSDGGKSWSRQSTGTDFTLASICFVDTTHGWAVGDRGTILHTKDGGTTWVKQDPPRITIEGAAGWKGEGRTATIENAPMLFFLMGVHFATPEKGWIVTEQTHILFTLDGGQTWSVQFKDEDFILQDLSFCDDQNGWAVGEYGYIYHTADGGNSWENQAGEFDFSEETGEIIGGNYLFDVTAVDPMTAWAVGIDGYVVRTQDGGVTWERVEKEFPKTHFFGVAADDKGVVVIGGRSALLVSTDAGKTFQPAVTTPPVRYGWLFGIGPRGDAGYTAVGKSQWIYQCDNDPISWRRTETR